MKVAELREELEQFGEKTTGNKAVLVERCADTAPLASYTSASTLAAQLAS